MGKRKHCRGDEEDDVMVVISDELDEDKVLGKQKVKGSLEGVLTVWTGPGSSGTIALEAAASGYGSNA